MKLLVVDDSRVMRRIVIRTLRQAGFASDAVIEAEDGAEGLAKALDESPDLILSEWLLPGMGGVEFLTALRGHGRTTPFGFLTSHASVAIRAEAEAAGALFVVAKPLTVAKIDGVLSAMLADAAPHPLARPTSALPVGGPRQRSAADWALTSLPSRQAVRETVETLLGRSVKAGDGDRVTLDLTTGTITVGAILDDQRRLAAVVCADLPLVVRTGACLGLFPVCVVQDLVAERDLNPSIRENFHEVLDVLSGTFNTTGAPYVRLGEVYTDPDAMPPRVLLAIKSLTRRDDVRLDVAGYGAGNLSLVLAEA